MRKLLILVLGMLCVSTTLSTATDAKGDEQENLRYPDVWCRKTPMTLEDENYDGFLASMYVDENHNPIAAYVVHDSRMKSTVLFYDFFNDQVIGKYESICDENRDCRTPDNIPVRNAELTIINELNLSRIDNFFSSLAPGMVMDALIVTTGSADYTISYRERPVHGGGRLRRTISDSGLYPLAAGLQKLSADGSEVFNVMLIQASFSKVRWSSFTSSPFWEGRDFALIHSRSIWPIIYDLKDGTYLLTGLNWPGLIRFRGALESPCIDESEQFIVVDAMRGRGLYIKALHHAEATQRKLGNTKPHQYLVDLADAYVTNELRSLISKHDRAVAGK